MILNFHDLHKKYSLNDISGVLHIGANIGNEYELYKQYNLDPIIFIEPLTHLYEKLCDKIQNDSSCITLQCAISNTTGVKKMYVESNGNRGSSSLLKPLKHKSQYPGIKFGKTEFVKVRQVDHLDIPNVNFINIDIQGNELNAFKGATRYLENVKYIISEVNRDELYENCTKVEELDEFLKEYNFTRVETSWDGNTWGDAFYIKDYDEEN